MVTGPIITSTEIRWTNTSSSTTVAVQRYPTVNNCVLFVAECIMKKQQMILLKIPRVFPECSSVTKFPDISRFSRQISTLFT